MSNSFRTVIHSLGPRTAFTALVGSAVLLLGGSSSAHPPVYAAGSPYSVSLEDDSGAPLRAFRKDGTTFVLGYVGDRYNVRIENHGDRRVEAVLTVDGRDAVSGSPGDYVHQRGYIVPAHDSVLVSGFRQSLERAAAFRFSEPEASYSARMGTPQNVGVIGVAFFPERVVYRARPALRAPEPRWRTPWEPMDDDRAAEASRPAPANRSGAQPAPAPAKRAATADAYGPSGGGRAYRETRRDEPSAPSRIGTEYGESTYSPVTEVRFERQDGSHPAALLSLRYDSAEGLMARGIDVYPRPYWPEPDYYAAPNPFPVNRFAPPPP